MIFRNHYLAPACIQTQSLRNTRGLNLHTLPLFLRSTHSNSSQFKGDNYIPWHPIPSITRLTFSSIAPLKLLAHPSIRPLSLSLPPLLPPSLPGRTQLSRPPTTLTQLPPLYLRVHTDPSSFLRHDSLDLVRTVGAYYVPGFDYAGWCVGAWVEATCER